MSAHDVGNFSFLAAQTPDRFEYGQIRFARAVLFETLTTANANLSVSWDHPRERVDQRRFSDAGFASDKPDLTLTVQHSLQPAVHSRDGLVAPDHARINKKRPGRIVVRSLLRLWFLLLLSELADKAIAAAV